jgi:putative DNA primase/helicase
MIEIEDAKEIANLKKQIDGIKKLFLDIYHTKLGDTYPHLLYETGEDSTYWLYNDDTGVYEEMNVATVRSIILKMIMRDGITPTVAWVRECLARYRAEYQNRAHKYGDFDNEFAFFHAQNGWLNLNTYELEPHTPERLSRFVSPTAYDPEATCPLYDNMLDNVFPIKKDAVRVIDQFSGYILTGDIQLGKMLIIQSKPGFGKSTLVEAWVHVLGIGQLAIKKSLSSLSSDGERFGGTKMLGKTLCWFDESRAKNEEFGTKLETLITGTHIVDIERKGINGIVDAENHLKCVLTANKLPQHKEDGVFRRIIYIRFPENVPTITDKMEEDPQMVSKLKNEASGILNRMLHGLKDLRKMGKFTMIEGEAELIEDMKISSDTLTEFLDTYYEPDATSTEFYSTQDMFEEYSFSDFYIGKRYIKSTRSFAYHLRERAPALYQETLKPSIRGNARGWTGIRLKAGYESVGDSCKKIIKRSGSKNNNEVW